ncbi:hypothetical protein ACFQ8T_20135 [Isoptericola sp. NPDC056618]|uniref:hypothetical protein n=1 Tax=Isoptericola sp. NPDC056618 TaxID=3345878 RepID=UPI0036CA17A9
MPTGAVEEELAAARAAVVGHAQQSARRQVAGRELAAAEDALADARASLADEAADVARLESLSLARVWAGLRGDRAQRLDAERAEQQAAEYVAATAQARRDAAEREVRAVDAGLAAAEVELRGADGWSTYDTFFDGGMLASMVKHDTMDRAAGLLREADGALRHLTVELGDLGEQGVGGVGVDGLTRTLDVWFDTIFTDWSVRNRIAEARDRVAAATRAVHGSGSASPSGPRPPRPSSRRSPPGGRACSSRDRRRQGAPTSNIQVMPYRSVTWP